MAAVQRTPTPIDPRSRMAFIESMEEELKRVQEHLGRRQWKQRNGSIPHSNSSTSSSSASSFRKQQQYYTLARSNPATRRRLWEPREKEEEDSDEPGLCRVNSAQDLLLSHHHHRRSFHKQLQLQVTHFQSGAHKGEIPPAAPTVREGLALQLSVKAETQFPHESEEHLPRELPLTGQSPLLHRRQERG